MKAPSLKPKVQSLFVLLTLAIGLLALDSSAQTLGNFTNAVAVPPMITAGSVSNVTLTAFAPRPGYGVGFEIEIWTTNSSTAEVKFVGEIAYVTTNRFSTTHPFTLIGNLNGATHVILSTNFPKELFESCKWVKIGVASNGHTASLFTSNAFLARPVSQR